MLCLEDLGESISLPGTASDRPGPCSTTGSLVAVGGEERGADEQLAALTREPKKKCSVY